MTLPVFARDQHVGLARQESRNLQDIDMRRHDGALLLGVDIGQHRERKFLAQFVEDGKCRVHAGAARRRQRGAVGLVVAGLVDEAYSEPAGQFLQRAGHVESVLTRLELARAGDQRQSRLVVEDDIADNYR